MALAAFDVSGSDPVPPRYTAAAPTTITAAAAPAITPRLLRAPRAGRSGRGGAGLASGSGNEM
ncbi:hypothetical protein ACFQ1L_25520 [Phytohabitans flavus]|uniref:hypothetical protein n=1 Tax=Phytohabitans flavus TaxID=1076124 RepID=UPI003637F6F5